MSSQSQERLSRYLEEQIGDCQPGDVDQRLTELETAARSADEIDLDSHVGLLSAIADNTRYRIVRVLAATDEELCVCELTPLMDVSDSAVSHALSTLTDAGVVKRRKQGRWRMYQLTAAGENLVSALDAIDSGSQ